MSEGDSVLKRDAEISSLVDKISSFYEGHRELNEEGALENNVRYGLTQVTSLAEVWQMQGRPSEDVNVLVKKGFEKVRELSPDEKSKKIALEGVDWTIERCSAVANQENVPPKLVALSMATKAVLEQNREVFTD